jgi:hypothetical protein
VLASLDDLVAIGALPVDYDTADPRASRAQRLLELASAQAVAYLRCDDETAVAALAGWTAAKATALAAIIAEAAGARLTVGAAPNVDPYASVEGVVSALLNRRHYRAIDKLIGVPGAGSKSVLAERDPDTSFLSQSMYGRYDPYLKLDL